MIRIAVLVSGKARGSTLGALMDACQQGEIDGEIALVIGTKPEAPALSRSNRSLVIEPSENEQEYGAALLQALAKERIDLVCLAGYLRKLPSAVVAAYRGRIMNSHPSLLPAFGGRGLYGDRVHRAVVESGVKVSGCTVHFVDEEYDAGPIILQLPVLTDPSESAEQWAQRLLPFEHDAYVASVRLFAEKKLRLEGRRVMIDDRPGLEASTT